MKRLLILCLCTVMFLSGTVAHAMPAVEEFFWLYAQNTLFAQLAEISAAPTAGVISVDIRDFDGDLLTEMLTVSLTENGELEAEIYEMRAGEIVSTGAAVLTQPADIMLAGVQSIDKQMYLYGYSVGETTNFTLFKASDAQGFEAVSADFDYSGTKLDTLRTRLESIVSGAADRNAGALSALAGSVIAHVGQYPDPVAEDFTRIRDHLPSHSYSYFSQFTTVTGSISLVEENYKELCRATAQSIVRDVNTRMGVKLKLEREDIDDSFWADYVTENQTTLRITMDASRKLTSVRVFNETYDPTPEWITIKDAILTSPVLNYDQTMVAPYLGENVFNLSKTTLADGTTLEVVRINSCILLLQNY